MTGKTFAFDAQILNGDQGDDAIYTPSQASYGECYHVILIEIDTEVLPCPFCGGKARPNKTPAKRFWTVECEDCRHKTPGRKSCDSAIAAWNRRAS